MIFQSGKVKFFVVNLRKRFVVIRKKTNFANDFGESMVACYEKTSCRLNSSFTI